jgi:hypothetical protein
LLYNSAGILSYQNPPTEPSQQPGRDWVAGGKELKIAKKVQGQQILSDPGTLEKRGSYGYEFSSFLGTWQTNQGHRHGTVIRTVAV